MSIFEIKKKCSSSTARTGLIKTGHGQVSTPSFLPIGTRGSVKAVTARELKFWGAEIVLANTYHLWMRPGDNLIRNHGGLHKFMGWDGPIFTDSGGFQVFSLGEKSRKNEEKSRGKDAEENKSQHGRVLKITNRGVTFRSDIDGQLHELTPEKSVEIQSNLGSDIALVLDFFPGYPYTKEKMKKAITLTLDWAERSKKQYEKLKNSGVNPKQILYGIVQGGDFADLRKECIEGLEEIGFDGYAIGGVAVGEPSDVMYRSVEAAVPHMPDDKPRHLLGVGTPEQLVQSVARGCDTFDCVLPTRNARHGLLYINARKGLDGVPETAEDGYTAIRITNEKYKEDFAPVDRTCGCYLCQNHTRSYLRHLFASQDSLALRLATMHNLRFYLDLMKRVRMTIENDIFQDLLDEYREY